MIGPKRIRLSRAKGWRLPEGAVNCARPGRWGNIFVVGRDGTRAQCVAKLVVLQQGFIALHGPVSVEAQLAMWRRLRPRSIAQLQGRDLACWCPLDDQPCHCDLYLHLANGGPLPAWAAQPIELPSVRLGMAARDLIKLQRTNAASSSGKAGRPLSSGPHAHAGGAHAPSPASVAVPAASGSTTG